jgi:acyl carrier protein
VQGDVLAQVKAAIGEFVEIDPDEITLESRLKEDLGADSLDLVEMVMYLEEQFNILIPDEDAMQLTTVGRVADYLSARMGQGPSWRRSTGMVRPGSAAPDRE